MRTTVTLEPDVEALVRARMKASGVSFKRALNDAIREGASARVDYAFTTTTFDLGVPSVDLTRATHLAADLENDEFVALAAKVEREAGRAAS